MRATAAVLLLAAAGTVQGGDLLGYLEDWVDMNWWNEDMPGQCLMGCFKPAPYLQFTTPYSVLNYGFTFLTETPEPKQVYCTNVPHSPKGNATKACPAWDGKAIYMAASDKKGSEVVTADTVALTPGMVAIMEAGRMAKMHPSGPKRMKISLGGWSDFARLGSHENAENAAKLVAKVVKMTFADGVDLDFEHLTPYSTIPGDDEFAYYATLVKTLKNQLETVVKPQWVEYASMQAGVFQQVYAALPASKQAAMKNYYDSNIKYCQEIAANGVPTLEVSWTTRFNAFLPADNSWNYLLPGSWHPNVTFATDREGDKIYPVVGQYIDTVNVMAYDAGPMKMNFSQILTNFNVYGKVPKEKVLIGFEPGTQFAGGIWEGLAADKKYAQWAKDNGYGGAFVWSANPSPITNKNGTVDAPIVAKAVNAIMEPVWHWGPTPTFTKCNPTTGWIN